MSSAIEQKYPETIAILPLELRRAPPQGSASFVTIPIDLFLSSIVPFFSAASLWKAQAANFYFQSSADRGKIFWLHNDYPLKNLGFDRIRVMELLARIGKLLIRLNLEGISPIDENLLALIPAVKHLTMNRWVQNYRPAIKSLRLTSLEQEDLTLPRVIRAGIFKNVETLFLSGRGILCDNLAFAAKAGNLAELRHLRIEKIPAFSSTVTSLIKNCAKLEQLELTRNQVSLIREEDKTISLSELCLKFLWLEPSANMKAQLEQIPVWGLKVFNFFQNNLGNYGALLLLKFGAEGKIPYLESLELGANEIDARSWPEEALDVSQAANKWPQLRFLGLSNNLITVQVLRLFTTLARNIQTLNLGLNVRDHLDVHFEVDQFIGLVEARMFLELRVLNLFRNTFASFINTHSGYEKGLPQLSGLNIGTYKITPEILDAFVTMAPHLQHLMVRNTGIQIAALIKLASQDRFLRLESLDLSKCLDGSGIEERDLLASVGKFSRLHTLDISESPSLVNQPIKQLIRLISPTLRHLSVSSLSSTSDQNEDLILKECIEQGLKLSTLTVSNGEIEESILEDFVRLSAAGNARLQILSLEMRLSALSVSTVALRLIEGALANLHTLLLPSRIQPRLLKAFIIMSPRLAFLELFAHPANEITIIDDHLQVIVELAANNLQQLKLESNRIGASGLHALFGTLFPNMRKMSLYKTRLGPTGAQVILKSLKEGKFPSLIEFELFDAGITKETGESLLAFAKEQRITIPSI